MCYYWLLVLLFFQPRFPGAARCPLVAARSPRWQCPAAMCSATTAWRRTRLQTAGGWPAWGHAWALRRAGQGGKVGGLQPGAHRITGMGGWVTGKPTAADATQDKDSQTARPAALPAWQEDVGYTKTQTPHSPDPAWCRYTCPCDGVRVAAMERWRPGIRVSSP